jgi:hypothetical protein
VEEDMELNGADCLKWLEMLGLGLNGILFRDERYDAFLFNLVVFIKNQIIQVIYLFLG